MLRHLRATNFALLSDVAVDFGPGFNVLTGETGAGKSLIVEAVNLLRGGRASADIPRKGAKEAVVEAIFEVPGDLRDDAAAILAEAGLPDTISDDPSEVLVRRVIQRGGRSRTYINGALTTAARLGQLGTMLVDLSGQHQHQGLVDSKRHLRILDAFAGTDAQREQTAVAVAKVSELAERITKLTVADAAAADRIDYLRFQLEEIDAADPQPGEDEQLSVERERLRGVDTLANGARAALDAVYDGGDSAADRIDAATTELARLVSIDPALADPVNQLQEARALVEEAATAVRSYAASLDGDPARLDVVEDRLATLARLLRKHGESCEEVLARAASLRAELGELENRGDVVSQLRADEKKATAVAVTAAKKLSAQRKKSATKLGRLSTGALAELGMAGAGLSVAVRQTSLGSTGMDQVEFVLAANAGEDEKPLTKVASGGELSRIMLALKLVLRTADSVGCYVFDEVDSGIGGAIAEVVGSQIRRVADHRQVLCVTHLPQIAAFADQHYVVSKAEDAGRTETSVRRLESDDREREVARMLAGIRVTDQALAHAREMLGQAARAPV